MASFRITIVELKPAPGVVACGPSGSEITVPVVAPQEVKVFEQTVEDLDVRKFARDFNKPVRKRRIAQV
jgi:hypothetical protein